MAPSSSSSILIKGYLPLRISLPSSRPSSSSNDNDKTEAEHSFLFLKEHIVTSGNKSGGNNNNDGSSNTLFVVNVPFIPKVRTKLFLHSLFDRYGDVDRVVVVKDPRSSSSTAENDNEEDAAAGLWRDQFQKAVATNDNGLALSYNKVFEEDDVNDEGKFAHIVFASPKEMKKALKRMTALMTSAGNDDEGGKKKKKKRNSSSSGATALPSVSFGKLELQELEDESKRLRKKELAGNNKDDFDFNDVNDENEQDDSDDNEEEEVTGIQALLKLQKQNIIPRSKLLEACNTIMSNFETAEEEAHQKRIAAASQPDEDGFITVTSSSTAPAPIVGGGSKRQLEKDGGKIRGKAGSKRARKHKESIGASELKDFYKFQMKESRKRGLDDLRKRFEEDLVKVEKMKEQKGYRPF